MKTSEKIIQLCDYILIFNSRIKKSRRGIFTCKVVVLDKCEIIMSIFGQKFIKFYPCRVKHMP